MTPPDGRQLTLDQLRQFQLLIMACRPADVSQKPAELQQMYVELAQSAPLEPGWREDVCRICAEAVHMGPRQRAQWEVSPKSFVVLCIECAVSVQQGLGGIDVIPIRNLGGK